MKNCETACRDFSSFCPMLPLVSKTMPMESGASSLREISSPSARLCLRKHGIFLIETGDEAVQRIGDGHRNLNDRGVDADIGLGSGNFLLAGRARGSMLTCGGSVLTGFAGSAGYNAVDRVAASNPQTASWQMRMPASLFCAQSSIGLVVVTSRVHRRILGVIPARYASSRFPGKALATLAGKSMLQHVYERVTMARYLDAVIIATDDERIAARSSQFWGASAYDARRSHLRYRPRGGSRIR